MTAVGIESPTAAAPVEPAPTRIAVPCPICASEDHTVLYPPGVAQINQIVRCHECGLMYANPRREAGYVLHEASTEEYHFAERMQQRCEKEEVQLVDTADTRKLLNELHPSRGKAIEIGSGTGRQLDRLRQDGWDVLGIDPDRNAARYAAETMGVPTVTAILETAGVADESADAVLMLHVIEHVADPVGTLREIFRVLKPGGHLVLETPRYDTLNFRLLGRRERSLSCHGHILFFTTETLRQAYALAGFELTKLDYVGRTMTLDRLVYNLGVMSKNARLRRLLDRASRPLRLHKQSITINARDMQRVCLMKPEEARPRRFSR